MSDQRDGGISWTDRRVSKYGPPPDPPRDGDRRQARRRMGTTNIEWTDAVWNCVRGCSRVSPGCENCYAERMAARFSGPGQPYEGLVRLGKNGPRWTGDVRLVPERLADPLRWRRPRRVFVNSMSDLFHEKLTNEEIAAVFGVMAAAPQHTFQVLTKRAERMREWFRWIPTQWMRLFPFARDAADAGTMDSNVVLQFVPSEIDVSDEHDAPPWPLRNVWLGVSVEDQQRADERISPLLDTPAAVRFVSVEPQLATVDLGWWLRTLRRGDILGDGMECLVERPGLDWVIIGGESGPGARPFNVQWARDVIADCKAAGVKVFVKQDSGPKPGQQGRIPDDLWIKEFPHAPTCARARVPEVTR